MRFDHGRAAEQRCDARAVGRGRHRQELEVGCHVPLRVERELPFGMLLDGIEISGVIDLAVQRADGAWTVLDYKSNDISRTGRLEHLVEYYGPQLELYALAMERAGLGDVSHCALVFLNGPAVRQWPFEDADAARAEGVARALLRGVSAEIYATEAGPKCAECGYRKRRICQVGRLGESEADSR